MLSMAASTTDCRIIGEYVLGNGTVLSVVQSSLKNALTRQWGLVRMSDKPGLTQTMNFFNLGSKLSVVDLPGYSSGYGKTEVKDAWEELVSMRVGLGL
ncbi:putative GTP-binding protein EngB [Vitis vinifera]|uniref:Putative GTP-binding protein EngB n=1 Tax=Vitis vinifera TaxID=29760 RepID=A0A438F928_VITVI|nr:putative GTP-binding protein EngB [Vitis vinifera]